MAVLRSALVARASAYLARLRFPTLFAVVLALFAVNVVVPDGLPFLDEILLGLLAAFLGRWRRRGATKAEEAPRRASARP